METGDVPRALLRTEPRALHEYLCAAGRQRSEEVALVVGGSAITYRDVAADAHALAHWLNASGIRRGDRVVVFGGNTGPTAVAFWAVLICGGVVVMVSPATQRDKLAWLLDDCGAVGLVTDASLAGRFIPAVAQSRGLRSLVVAGAWPDPAGVSGIPHVVSFERALKEGANPETPLPAQHQENLAALVYTSGSTGKPKAVMLTHRNMIAATRAISQYLGLTASDVLLCVLPLSFDYGLYQLILSVSVGARLVLERSFDLPGQVLNRVAAERVTILPGVPTIFALLARLGNVGRWDLASVRIVTSTGAVLGPEGIAWLQSAFPAARIFSMYGLTECKRCTYLPPDDLARKPGSVGVAIPGTEIWLVDTAGQILGPGHVGELVVCGPTVMAGYWARPDETAQRLRPGRSAGEVVLHTGDLCRMDEDGYLYFVARMDDIIKSRGAKVAPAEVESALMSVPGVIEAAVVGVPDPVLGQGVKAFVVLAAESVLTPEAVRDACKERLEPSMVPGTVKVVPALPRTPSGKIAKHALA